MRACWLKWVGRDWSISADYIWLNYSGANTTKSTTTVTKTTVAKVPKPKAATATTVALPKTGDSNWITASVTLFLLGTVFLAAACRC